MTFKIRFTEEALADLERLYDFALERDDGDWTTAERALAAIRNGLGLLGDFTLQLQKGCA
jgi:plasmid stabilization system protein ParE